jgi:hypothetical protein
MGLFGGIWNENAVNLYLEVWISWILCLVMKQHMVSPVWIDFVFLVWSFHLEIECHIWDAFYQSRWECIAHLRFSLDLMLYTFVLLDRSLWCLTNWSTVFPWALWIVVPHARTKGNCLRVAVTGPCLMCTSCNSMGVELSSGECVHKICGRTYGQTNMKKAITLAKINHPWNQYNMRMLRSWPIKIPNMNKMRQKKND